MSGRAYRHLLRAEVVDSFAAQRKDEEAGMRLQEKVDRNMIPCSHVPSESDVSNAENRSGGIRSDS